jgi:hypothetical protein
MRRMGLSAAVMVMVLAALACGPLGDLGNLTGGARTGPVTSLWSDVPAYPGAARVDIEMPLPLRMAVEAMGNITQLPGDSGTLQDLQFIAFTTADSADQIQAFYTKERMAGDGWDSGEGPGCGGAEAGAEQFGAMCVFAKETATKNSALFVVATAGEAGESVIFFIRADGTP